MISPELYFVGVAVAMIAFMIWSRFDRGQYIIILVVAAGLFSGVRQELVALVALLLAVALGGIGRRVLSPAAGRFLAVRPQLRRRS